MVLQPEALRADAPGARFVEWLVPFDASRPVLRALCAREEQLERRWLRGDATIGVELQMVREQMVAFAVRIADEHVPE